MLIHLFEIESRHYVYDVVRNGIAEVSPEVVGVLASGDIRGDEDEQALAEIAAAREVGLFRPMTSTISREAASFLCPDDYDRRLRHLVLTLTESCNNRCTYCLHESDKPWVRPHGVAAMSEETALAALAFFADRCSDTRRPAVSFYGGEPLLRFDLIRKLVLEAAGRSDWPDLQFIVSTNGVLLDNEVVDFVLEHRIRLQISLDGPSEVHDRHRVAADGSPTHRAVEQAIERILSRDPSFHDHLSFIATLAPPYDLQAVSAYFRNFPPYRATGVVADPMVEVNLADLEGNPLAQTVDPAQRSDALQGGHDEFVQACAAGRRGEIGPVLPSMFEPDLVRFYHRSLAPLSGAVHPTGTCAPGVRKLHVAADGAFQPCERVGRSLAIGHVDDGFDMEAVAGSVDALYDSVADRCSECWAVRMCSVCLTALAPGTDGVDSFCDRSRARAEATLKLYATLLDASPTALDHLADRSKE